MSHQSDLIEKDIDAYLKQHEQKELLRFLTCGSVDDGKSTLIGRLLYDSKMIYADQLSAIKKDSIKHGTTEDEVDLALLMDGLKAEREQGITIDVAYRYFSTAKRKFIIADTPGHEQYTRNMVTGASTCDLAIILIDARKGILPQTKRHSFIASLLGIKHVVVAINKMDLPEIDFSQQIYEQIKKDYSDFASKLDLGDVHFIPISALKGDNVVDPSEKTPWYLGSTLMHHLETVYIASDRNMVDMRFPVQYVNRPHLNFRGFCGTLASGIIRQGDEVMSIPSRKTSRVKSIVTYDGELKEAFAPLAVTVTLEDEIDTSRGDMLVHPGNIPRSDQEVEAMVVWMAEEPLMPGKEYTFKQTTKLVSGMVSTLRYRIDINTLSRAEAPTLSLNEIGRCHISLNRPIAFDPYKRNRGTGSFIMIDKMTNVTVGAGMILDRATSEDQNLWDATPRSSQLQAAEGQVSGQQREARFGQKPVTILLTGLTGSGKTSIAYALERRLFDEARSVTVLDGQNMRRGISRDLGFSAQDRSENLRRCAEVAKLMNNAGLICISAFVAPDRGVREKVKQSIGENQFLEIFLSAPIEVCRQRDTEGMYTRADEGEIESMPGVSAPYEEPTDADLVLKTETTSVEECVDQLIGLLKDKGFIS